MKKRLINESNAGTTVVVVEGRSRSGIPWSRIDSFPSPEAAIAAHPTAKYRGHLN